MKRRIAGYAIGTVALTAAIAFAATQLLPTKIFFVKTEKALWKVVDKTGGPTVMGDPVANGAKLGLALNPGQGSLCASLPASGWTPISTIGFKYKDAQLVNGPVKVALIKRTPSGTFLLKAVLKGPGVTITPAGTPGTTYTAKLRILGAGGDSYCSGSGTATPSNNEAGKFKVKNDTTPGSCLNTCSPSGAFLD